MNVDVHFLCDGCGRVGTEEDGIYDDGDECPDEECEGTVDMVELKRVEDFAELLREEARSRPDLAEALKTGAAALNGLAIAYRTNRLWTVDGSSGADDAAFLYSILTDIGLEVP